MINLRRIVCAILSEIKDIYLYKYICIYIYIYIYTDIGNMYSNSDDTKLEKG